MDSFKQEPLPDDFDIELSAVHSDREDESQPTASLPLEQRLSPQARARRIALAGGALLVAVALVFGSIPALRNQALRLLSSATSPMPRVVTSLSVPPPHPGQGWSLAGPRYASMIAFAPSAPALAYTCGALNTSGGKPGPIRVGISSDSGRTWQMLSMPATAVTCGLTVDPTNAQDVVLFTNQCYQCPTPLVSKMYRTSDGGKHWRSLPLPPLNANQSPELLYTQWVWVGSTLFVAPYLAGDSGYVRLAASIAGQAFVWLKTEALFAGVPADTRISGLLATSTTLYLLLFSQMQCPPTCSWVMQSQDQGTSWSRFAPTVQGQSVGLMAAGADGRTLLGQTVHHDPPYSRVYLRSTDSGTTWQALAAKPDKLFADPMYEAPDGAIYAAFEKDSTDPTAAQGASAAPGIYALAPGALAWRYVAPTPPRGSFTVAWDEHGHPIALWGNVDYSDLIPGLESHQP